MADTLPRPAVTKRLLIADDEPHVRRILATLFEAAGFQLDLVDDGGEALGALRGPTPYDLVILDIVMPVASGLTVLEEIRATEHRRHTPVIILTAKGQDADRETAVALGADRFLTKPFSPKKLLIQVDELLAGR